MGVPSTSLQVKGSQKRAHTRVHRALPPTDGGQRIRKMTNTADIYWELAYELDSLQLWSHLFFLRAQGRWWCYVPNFIHKETETQKSWEFAKVGFPCGSAGKESACNVGDLGSIPGLGRSPGEGKGYPLQYSGLENPMDCIVHGIAKSHTQLSGFHVTSQIWNGPQPSSSI